MDISEAENEGTFRHWEQYEDLRYHFFLILTYKKNKADSKKEFRYFVQMSDFIGRKKKNQIQCRSHHQKKIRSIQKKLGRKNKERLEISILKSFYKNFYLDRLLGVQKLISEIKHHLSKKIRKNTEFKENYKRYLLNLENVVQKLMKDMEKTQSQTSDDESLEESQLIINQNQEQSAKVTEESQKSLLSQNQIQLFVNKSQIFNEYFPEENWLMLPQNEEIINFASFDKFSKLSSFNATQDNVLDQ